MVDMYILVHEHRHGADAHTFRADFIPDPDDYPKIAQKLDINFEPHLEETLTLVTADEKEAPTITKADLGAIELEEDGEDEENDD